MTLAVPDVLAAEIVAALRGTPVLPADLAARLRRGGVPERARARLR
ncbi:MAG: hypothetical protein ACRDRS_05640 [Pseudonocardiaceae bacterium]